VSYAHADSVSLKKIVDLFYERALAHPELGRFFVGIDMGKLKRHQVGGDPGDAK
jgi:truncated hemoglobin YjbI